MDSQYDVVIIGAGSAGLTASIFISRYGLKNLVIERSMPGGQVNLTDKIENYPGFKKGISGVSLGEKFKNHAKKYGVKISNKEVTSIEEDKSKLLVNFSRCNEIKTSTVIISTGAHPRRLSIPGEEKLTGKGVSYCAICDGPLFKNRTVAVIGGGNTAAQEALYLSNIAESVKLIHRRDRLRAVKQYGRKINETDNIDKIFNSLPTEIVGEKMVEGLKIEDLEEEEEKEIECDGVFIFIGYVPNSEPFKKMLQVDSKGYILTNDKMETSCEGIFAAGDVRSKSLRQVVTACSDGAIAGDSAFKYIRKMKGKTYKDWEDVK